jgi:regulator of cell morphogenesis and NO signaling
MNDLRNKTIAEIVSDDISTASVFKKYQLDFCCGGGKTIAKACENKEINIEDLLDDLENVNVDKSNPNLNFKDWKLDFLIDYIVNIHHTYINENVGVINEFAQKVATVHGEHNPENIEIANLFVALSNELLAHMQKEERILFPAIKQMVQNDNKDFPFGSIDNPVRMMEHEHDDAGDIIKKIQQLSNNFTPPAHACNTYKALYHKLDEFANDLFQHIHLENNILFQKARDLEEQLNR